MFFCNISNFELRKPFESLVLSDVYFHIHHFYSSSPILWEVNFQQNHEWEHLIMAPLFEFRDERHLKAFLLLFKVPLLKGNAETGTRSTNGEVLQVHAPTLEVMPSRSWS